MSDVLSPAPTPVQSPSPAPVQSRRLMSLDALRGFDMFWIVGGEELVHALYSAWPNPVTGLLHRQMEHQPWKGVHFYDLIFPLFVFIVGASLVFSLTRLLAEKGREQALKRILIRSLIIYFFGLLVYDGLANGIEQVRWMGVLQRIAICYLFTGFIFCTFKLRSMIAICASLLLGYWALASLVPIRDFNLETSHLQAMHLEPSGKETRIRYLSTTELVHNRFEDGLNLPQHIDFLYLPGHRWDGAYDPEGILSTLGAIGTCLLGVFAGLLLKNGKVSDQRKVMYLTGAGVASVALGFLWGREFPVIKKIVEVWQWRRWCIPFVWIGMNPITIYLAFHLISFGHYAEMVAGGPVKAALGPWGQMGIAIVVVGMMFAFVRFLYQRKIFLRV
jgi:predicted acyltransferase